MCNYRRMRLYRPTLALACLAMLVVTTFGAHTHVDTHLAPHDAVAHAEPAAAQHSHVDHAGFAPTVHGAFDLSHLIGHMLDGDIDVDQSTALTGKASAQPVLIVALFMLLLVSLLAPPVRTLPARRRERPPRRHSSSRFMPPPQAPPVISQMR